MKYLIILITSLFYLTSFSDHTKSSPMTKQEVARYNELLGIHYSTEDLSDEDQKEYEALKEKLTKQWESLDKHFNEYMWLEYLLFNAETGDPAFLYHSYTVFRDKDSYDLTKDRLAFQGVPLRYLNLPDCTRERLQKNECPKPPHLAIYWAKKLFYAGDCIEYHSRALSTLMDSIVIPKMDIRGHESLFYTLAYMTHFIQYKVEQHERGPSDINYFKRHKQKELKEGKISEKEFEEQVKQRIKDFDKWIRQYADKAKKRLSKKDLKIAHKMIDDLFQKWAKKYGKDEIYTCRSQLSFGPELNRSFFLQREFLKEHYPYLSGQRF